MIKPAALILSLACACGSPHTIQPDGAPPDVAVDAPLPTYAPPVLPNHGGPVLAAPALIAVTWPGDALAADIHAFDSWYVASQTWLGTVAQYHVGAGTATAWTAPAAAPATMDDSDIQLFLRDRIEHGTLTAPTANTLYVLYPPATTTITETFGTTVYRSCEAFEGYHGATSLTDGTRVYYAVAARCSQPGWPLLDLLTGVASHEIAEAATDSDPATNPAWQLTYDPAQPWIAPFGGEIGDLCEGMPLHIENHVVTALYSNAAAAAFQRTCVPAPPGPMFAAASETRLFTITPGDSAQTTIRIVSSDPDASNLTFLAYSLPPGSVTVTPSSATVAANDQFALNLAVPASTPAGEYVVVLQVRDASYPSFTYLILRP
jgi:hypothetical protein